MLRKEHPQTSEPPAVGSEDGQQPRHKRTLEDVDIVALMVDGIEFGEHTLVVALGIDSSGEKHPLAMREGSTENASLCRGVLADIVDRGVPADRTILVVIDGGKATPEGERGGS